MDDSEISLGPHFDRAVQQADGWAIGAIIAVILFVVGVVFEFTSGVLTTLQFQRGTVLGLLVLVLFYGVSIQRLQVAMVHGARHLIGSRKANSYVDFEWVVEVIARRLKKRESNVRTTLINAILTGKLDVSLKAKLNPEENK